MLARAGVLLAILTVTAAGWEVYRRTALVYADAMKGLPDSPTRGASGPAREPVTELTLDLACSIFGEFEANPVACGQRHFGKRYRFEATVTEFGKRSQVTMMSRFPLYVTFESRDDIASLSRDRPTRIEGVLEGVHVGILSGTPSLVVRHAITP